MNNKLPLAFAFALFAFHADAQGLGVGLGGTHVNVGLGGGGVAVGVGAGGLASVGAGLGTGGVSANVGVAGGAVNAGVGAGTGGVGASVGVGSAVNVDAGVSGSGLVANVGVAGVGTGVSAGSTGLNVGVAGAGGGSGSTGSAPAGSTAMASVDPMIGRGAGRAANPPSGHRSALVTAFVLPAALRPNDHRRQNGRQFVRAVLSQVGEVDTTLHDVALDRRPLRALAGTPYETVAACRSAILLAAQSYNPVYATTASGGMPRRLPGGFVAPIETKLVYMRRGGYEVRTAKVQCRVTVGGQVASIS